MTKSPDRLLPPYVVAYRWGYREIADRPTFGAKAKTAAERIDEASMNRFRVALSEGRLPRPDKYIGRIPHWRESTVAAFVEGGELPAGSVKPLRKPGRPAIAKAGAHA